MKAIITAFHLKQLIGATKKFVGTSELSPMQMYIRIEFSRSKQTATASAIDGYRISEVTKFCIVEGEDFTVYVRPTLPISQFKGERVCVELDGDYCRISCGDLSVGCKQPTGQFFDTEEYIAGLPTDPPRFRIGFNAQYLLDVLQAAKLASPESIRSIITLEFQNPQSPVITRGINGGTFVILPVRVKE